MCRTFIEVACAPGDLLSQVSNHMGWEYVFSSLEIQDLQLFLVLMDPLEELFSSLNSEKVATIHLVLPTVRVCNRIVSGSVK